MLLDLLANEPHAVRRVVVASSRSIYGEGTYRSPDGAIVYPPHRAGADMAAGDFDVYMPGEGALDARADRRDCAAASVVGLRRHEADAGVARDDGRAGARRSRRSSLRYQNVYGPGQSLNNPYTGILSIFSTLIRQGKAIDIFEDGLESRDFVYIDDVVDATVRACVAPGCGGGTLSTSAPASPRR